MALPAAASTGLDNTQPVPRSANAAPAPAPLLQLAQYANVEIYIDEYGRRVIVDSFTGEVLGVERPRAYRNREAYRRALRARELGRDPGYDIYDPNYEVPYRPRALDDDVPYRPRRLDDPEYAYPEDAFPEEPQTFPEEPEVARELIERGPLAAPGEEGGTAGVREWTTEGDGTATDGGSEPGATEPGVQPSITFGARDQVAALQVLLDRKGASPGVIDGTFGSNVDKALEAYRNITGENLHSTDTQRIKTNLAATGGDPFMQYTITQEDAAGPYVASVPADYGAKAKLDRLSYTSVPEMLAERFHMDEAFLKALNPGANFGRPGTVIKVVNVGGNVTGKVTGSSPTSG